MAPVPRKKLTAAQKATPTGKFAVRLQALLDEREWSVSDFAGKCGLDNPTVRRWLRGDGFPKVELMPKIGKALNTSQHPFPDWRLILPEKL